MPGTQEPVCPFAGRKTTRGDGHVCNMPCALERSAGGQDKRSVAALIAAKRKLPPGRVLLGLTIIEAISRAFLGLPEVF